MKLICKKNLKNYRWWIALLFVFIYMTVLSPLIVILVAAGFLFDVIDMISEKFDTMLCKIGRMSRILTGELKRFVEGNKK